MLDQLSPKLQRFEGASDRAYESYQEYLEVCRQGDVAQVQQLLAQQTQRGQEWVSSGIEQNPRQQQRKTWWLVRGLEEAVKNENILVMEYLHSEGALIRYHTVEAAKSRGSWEFLLNHGLDVNNPMPEAKVPLLHVVSCNDPELLTWFLSLGADPNYGPNESRLLREEGAIQPYSQPEKDSGAALEMAAWECDIEIFELLLEHGAKLENSLALHRAMMRNSDDRIAFAERILSHGADINRFGHLSPVPLRGGTALAVAARLGTLDEIRWLLEHGVDQYIGDSQGLTASHYAYSTVGSPVRFQRILDLLNEFKRPQ